MDVHISLGSRDRAPVPYYRTCYIAGGCLCPPPSKVVFRACLRLIPCGCRWLVRSSSWSSCCAAHWSARKMLVVVLVVLIVLVHPSLSSSQSVGAGDDGSIGVVVCCPLIIITITDAVMDSSIPNSILDGCCAEMHAALYAHIPPTDPADPPHRYHTTDSPRRASRPPCPRC